jgi:plasmid stabilization system protein ParE
MKIEYSLRAIRDLTAIGAYYRTNASETVANAAAERIRHVINVIGQHPHVAPQMRRRPGIRVAVVLQYPFLVFYRIRVDAIEIVHVRHTSRRPWSGDR